MSDSRALLDGTVYRQLFDAQAQLSRSLLAGRTDTETGCLSAEDSDTHCSTASRWLHPPSSRGQQSDTAGDDDVSRLPDTVVVKVLSSDIMERLTEKKRKKHQEALKQLETELAQLSEAHDSRVRSISLELLSSLQAVNLRLNVLKDRMEHLQHAGLQEGCALWEEVEQKVKLKKNRLKELKRQLTKTETEQRDKIRVVFRKIFHLLQEISFLPPCDVCRLIHHEASMVNQSLLTNRRIVARLLVLLQEENLEQELLLRLHWEENLSQWRSSRVSEVIDRYWSLCSSGDDQQLVSVQQMKLNLNVLTEQRCDIITRISSLVPPTCSTDLVSDWFSQLTDINQQIERFHDDFLLQLRCSYEQTWQNRLAEVEHCEEALSALQLSEEEVNDIISSQLLPLIGRSQSQDEKRLAALDLSSCSAACLTLSLSRCVFVVMRAAALLWETHCRRLKRREEDLQQHLDELRASQHQETQKKKERLDVLLAGLRQESSEDALKMSLDRAVLHLQDIRHRCGECVSAQCRLVDRLPSVLLDELLAYSRGLASFYHLDHAYTPSPEDLQNLQPSSRDLGTREVPEIKKPEEGNRPISCQSDTDPAQPSQDWLMEAEASLLELYDISSDVVITSSRGAVYNGPAFRCPAFSNLQQERHLSVFPVGLLSNTLSRTRTLFLDHLEQHIHGFISSSVATVTDRKEAVRLEQEVQLKHLNLEHIESHVARPRLAELRRHRQHVDTHCEQVLYVLTSCRAELQELQTSVSRSNQDFIVTLSNMERDVLTVDSSQRLEVVSSTLQDCHHQHIKHTQSCETTFRQTVQMRLEEVRNRTSQLLHSFRLFSEGGDFTPQEVKLFQRRLKEVTKQIRVTEESISTQLEVHESTSLQQVEETLSRFEEKLCLLKSEVEFIEKIQQVLRNTRVCLKAEAASSNQQQSFISRILEDLETMMEDMQVGPDQVFSFLSSVNEELVKRCQYLDLSLESLSARLKSRKQVRSAPHPVSLQPSRTGVDLLEDSVSDVIRSLSRSCGIQDDAQERGRAASGEASFKNSSLSTECPVQRRPKSISAWRRCRSIKADRRFHVFGPEPEPGPEPQSFSSSVTSLLWRANDMVLLVAEDFYRSERASLHRLLLVPDSVDQWAEDVQQRLLGYQGQAGTLLSTSREELVDQLSVLDKLLRLFPAVLIINHEQRQGAELREEVGGVRVKLQQLVAASEKEKAENLRQLRAALRDGEVLVLSGREELRLQRLHSAICSSHLQLQERVRVRGEEFVTSLASLTEKLFRQLDASLSPAETDSGVTTATEAGPCSVSRTWSGISFLSPPVTTTASITTARCTLGHVAVIEQRDAAVKRFEQLFRCESSLSDEDKQSGLRDLESWRTHWRQQIHKVTHTDPSS